MMFKWLTKKSSLNTIIGFRRELVQRYGQSSVFTPEQVLAICDQHKVPQKYLFFAIALYCSEDDYIAFAKDKPNSPDYDEIRNKVIADIMKRAEPVVTNKVEPKSSAHNPQSNESAASSYGLGAD
ncbi:DUF6559 family protein [Kordiimonas sp. SCSIO 12610]|uniref:DUF6559 family protein n=1 Tax=Kordiimonas sp. SCSIO 12610 TaxID=2829597 RepID=UPI00210C5EAC|nr:DUF6559 family protein [Kordiimonas sp. SCSIO 12610]UTW56673.1 hypothetical protein KFF44_07230 [Kordiimonas sp. SCSIO 12610]